MKTETEVEQIDKLYFKALAGNSAAVESIIKSVNLLRIKNYIFKENLFKLKHEIFFNSKENQNKKNEDHVKLNMFEDELRSIIWDLAFFYLFEFPREITKSGLFQIDISDETGKTIPKTDPEYWKTIFQLNIKVSGSKGKIENVKISKEQKFPFYNPYNGSCPDFEEWLTKKVAGKINEWIKSVLAIHSVSISDPITGTEGITYGDVLPSSDNIEKQFEDKMLVKSIEEGLTPRQKEYFNLTMQGLTIKNIATELQITPDAARKINSRIKRIIKKIEKKD